MIERKLLRKRMKCMLRKSENKTFTNEWKENERVRSCKTA
jgi:hypothetical protein